MPELVGDTRNAQEPGLLSPVEERAEPQRAASTGGVDHDTDVIASPRAGAVPKPACEPAREPHREPDLDPGREPGREPERQTAYATACG